MGREDGDSGYRALTLDAGRGPVAARLYGPDGCSAAAIMVGGIGGGFGSPARGLYPALAGDLAERGALALRVRYRNPVDLGESVADVAAGIDELARRGVARVALVGHSFGGAVVIAAGAASPPVVAVAALATQSYGTEAAGRLSPRSLLLVHGTADRVLPSACSVHVYDRAGQPKELRLVRGAGHAGRGGRRPADAAPGLAGGPARRVARSRRPVASGVRSGQRPRPGGHSLPTSAVGRKRSADHTALRQLQRADVALGRIQHQDPASRADPKLPGESGHASAPSRPPPVGGVLRPGAGRRAQLSHGPRRSNGHATGRRPPGRSVDGG